MGKQAKSSFKIKSGNQRSFSEVEGGPMLTKGSYAVTYKGDLQGEGILEELKIHHTNVIVSIYGLERIVGKLGEKAGSFVLEHRGSLENGIIRSKRTVVPDSATGALKGLHGEIDFISGSGKEFPIVLDYYFE
jgi:uncharacterized protein DUF3224